MKDNLPRRYTQDIDYKNMVPIHVVWEITLACNLKCAHCGSRAGLQRPGELSFEECKSVIDHLSSLGTREITIIGGEAFLRKDWLQIIEYITNKGIDCSMQTGAFMFNEKRILDAKKAGIKNIGVSIDGLSKTHDEIRGRRGSFEHATRALELIKKHDLISSVNTVITSKNKSELNSLLDTFIDLGVKNWQVQLAVAMGNAVDNDYLLIQPFEIIEIIDRLFGLYKKGLKSDLLIQPGNNIGYFGPYEHIWRQGSYGYFNGCSAGNTSIGIEANGDIKGCPSLPTSSYVGGNIREMSLTDIWQHAEELKFTRKRNTNELWGGCKNCYYAEVCYAGCTWTGHVLLGKRGNNPYCYHRASELRKSGLFERISKISNAPGTPFDHGAFQIEVVNLEDEVVDTQRSIDVNFNVSGSQDVPENQVPERS